MANGTLSILSFMSCKDIEPFGQGNPISIFYCSPPFHQIEYFGLNKNHVKFVVCKKEALLFKILGVINVDR
jgi:hypothetical protein